MVRIPPQKQRVWEWPGVINFLLGGMAAGFYLLSSLVVIWQDGLSGLSQPSGFKLLAPALVALGFLSLAIEAGRPLRGYHLFRHLRLSWMSRESLAGLIFVIAAALDWFIPQQAIWGLAAAAGMGLIVSHGFIVYRTRPILAWNLPIIPILFLTSGFATGSGLMLLTASGRSTLENEWIVVALICVALDAAIWFAYLYRPQDAAYRKATQDLRQRIVVTAGIGHLLPILLLLLLLLASDVDARASLWRIVAGLAGVAIIVGGISQKAGIILRAGYFREMILGSVKDDAQGKNASLPFSSPAVHQ